MVFFDAGDFDPVIDVARGNDAELHADKESVFFARVEFHLNVAILAVFFRGRWDGDFGDSRGDGSREEVRFVLGGNGREAGGVFFLVALPQQVHSMRILARFTASVYVVAKVDDFVGVDQIGSIPPRHNEQAGGKALESLLAVWVGELRAQDSIGLHNVAVVAIVKAEAAVPTESEAVGGGGGKGGVHAQAVAVVVLAGPGMIFEGGDLCEDSIPPLVGGGLGGVGKFFKARVGALGGSGGDSGGERAQGDEEEELELARHGLVFSVAGFQEMASFCSSRWNRFQGSICF